MRLHGYDDEEYEDEIGYNAPREKVGRNYA